MPGLCLTVSDASRLWGMTPHACESALVTLVEQRVLTRTRRGAFVQHN